MYWWITESWVFDWRSKRFDFASEKIHTLLWCLPMANSELYWSYQSNWTMATNPSICNISCVLSHGISHGLMYQLATRCTELHVVPFVCRWRWLVKLAHSRDSVSIAAWICMTNPNCIIIINSLYGLLQSAQVSGECTWVHNLAVKCTEFGVHRSKSRNRVAKCSFFSRTHRSILTVIFHHENSQQKSASFSLTYPWRKDKILWAAK